MSDTPNLSRRGFITAAACAGTLLALPGPIHAASGYWEEPRVLKLYRSETKETVEATYWENNGWNLEGYVKICKLMRDIHQNQSVQMDRNLLDTLRGITWWLAEYGYTGPIHINSGYRTHATNNKLVKTEGAARNSLHTMGRATDIRVPGITPELLARMGLYFKVGVGLYSAKNFIHVDSGWPRFWRK